MTRSLATDLAGFASAATYRVHRQAPTERPSPIKGIIARGLSRDSADALARSLRAADPENVYRVTTAPLAEQVELAAAALAVRDAAAPTPAYRLAA